MPIYRPRCAAFLGIPLAGTRRSKEDDAQIAKTTTFEVKVHRATLTLNDHNAADELDIELSWAEAGVDPRFLSAANIAFHMGDAGEDGVFEPTPLNRRFVGIAMEVEREVDEQKKRVRIRFQDYTSLFLRSKPYPAQHYPHFSQTLQSAWETICDHTGYYDLDKDRILSSVEKLKKRLVFRGNASPDMTLGDAALERLRSLGKINPGTNKSSWDVWQHCCGSLALITFIRQDRVIVTDAAAYYTSENPPVLTWGRNILKLTERRDTDRTGKFICLTSVNPLTGAAIEAFWPPRDKSAGIRTEKKRRKPGAHAKKPRADDNLIPLSDYEVMPYPYGVTDEKMLEACCQRVYEERSRQELTGTLVTREMFAPREATRDARIIGREGGGDFDLLRLGSGDLIKVVLEEDYKGALASLGSDAVRYAYLRDVAGYGDLAARLIVDNMSDLGSLEPVFCVRTARTELEELEDGGLFQIEIEFCNRFSETAGGAT